MIALLPQQQVQILSTFGFVGAILNVRRTIFKANRSTLSQLFSEKRSTASYCGRPLFFGDYESCADGSKHTIINLLIRWMTNVGINSFFNGIHISFGLQQLIKFL
jgi:hypothetical protein